MILIRNKSSLIRGSEKTSVNSSPPSVKALKAMIKSPSMAPIPMNVVEKKAIFGFFTLLILFLIISTLTGPRGAVSVMLRVAIEIQMMIMSIMINHSVFNGV